MCSSDLIERRRQEELNKHYDNLTALMSKEEAYKGDDNISKKINAKYDAELTALKGKKPKIVKVYHHTKVKPEDFNFSSFQRGKDQISQFGDGLNASTETTPFLVGRYGNPIEGEVEDSDFVVIDANKSEKELYEELSLKGYKFNNPATGSYIGNNPAKEYDGTEKANVQPAIISLFNDFQKSNPEVKGVKVINHIIAGQKVNPFYVIYDAKSFYGPESLSKEGKKEEVKEKPIELPIQNGTIIIKAPSTDTYSENWVFNVKNGKLVSGKHNTFFQGEYRDRQTSDDISDVEKEYKKVSGVKSYEITSKEKPTEVKEPVEGVKNVKEALKALDEKELITDPTDSNYYINKNNPSERFARVSTLKGEFDGVAGDSANRGTIIDNLLRDFVAGKISSLEDLTKAYDKYSDKYEADHFSDDFLKDLFEIGRAHV